MSHETAARVVALRPTLEALVVKATTAPESVSAPTRDESELMSVIRGLSLANAGRHGVQDPQPDK